MLSWVVDVVGTFALSLAAASWFLQLRCRGIGPPFGSRAKPWAVIIVVSTAIASTGLGLILVAASHYIHAAYAGLIVPGGLWLTNVSAPPDRPGAGRIPKLLTACLTLPLGRLYDRMGEDMQTWCDTRRRAAADKPQWISDAAKYYYAQVEGQLKDREAQAELGRWRESIMHKINIVRLINLDTTPARLKDSLQMHHSTRHIRKYADDDLPRLARRLETEALNELHLFLAYVYRLGYHKLLIYPFRPSAQQASRPSVPEPNVPEPSVPEPGRHPDVK
jgi:hypothetical protein